jgi:hypothetical protein
VSILDAADGKAESSIAGAAQASIAVEEEIASIGIRNRSIPIVAVSTEYLH